MKPFNDKTILVKKANTQTVNNSTVLVNDNGLFYTFTQTGLYRVVVRCRCDGSNAADIKSAWNADTGIALVTSRYCMGIGTNNGSAVDRVDTMSVQHTSSLGTEIGKSVGWFEEEFFIEVTITNTKLTLKWAQLAAVASNTRILSNSHMVIEKVYWH